MQISQEIRSSIKATPPASASPPMEIAVEAPAAPEVKVDTKIENLDAALEKVKVQAKQVMMESEQKIQQQTEKNKQRAEKELDQVVENINKYISKFNYKIRFDVDKRTDNLVARIIKEDGQVVKEIPPEEMLAMSAKIKEAVKGMFVDQAG